MSEENRTESGIISGTQVNLDKSNPSLVSHSLKVRVIEGPDRGHEWEVKAPRLHIGTSKSNDVILNDKMVSRFHCQVMVRGDQYVLRDMGSTNGTYLQSAPIVETFVAPGTRIQLGQTELLFECRKKWVPLVKSKGPHFGQLVGKSQFMRSLFGLLERVSRTELSCVICGETGTGKELAARGIHAGSKRSTMPFVTVDCGALPDTLIQSEIFGHAKGAFTGAYSSRIGAFDAAKGGTLFLDEIGELPLEMQPKLLGALERREIRPLGSETPIEVDVRILCATHRDLSSMVKTGDFREDLFYRLSEVVLTLPPLRDHIEDLEIIVEKLINNERKHGTLVTSVDPKVFEVLSTQPWNGNVRELRNVIRRAVALCQTDRLELVDLSLEAHQGNPLQNRRASLLEIVEDFEDQPLKLIRQKIVAEFEKQYLEYHLKKYGDDIEQMSQVIGLHPGSVQRLLKQRGLK